MTPSEGRRPKSRTLLLTLSVIILVAVAVFGVPLATIFTLGVLLMCPLLMIGMHGGDHRAEHGAADTIHVDRRDRSVDTTTHVP